MMEQPLRATAKKLEWIDVMLRAALDWQRTELTTAIKRLDTTEYCQDDAPGPAMGFGVFS